MVTPEKKEKHPGESECHRVVVFSGDSDIFSFFPLFSCPI